MDLNKLITFDIYHNGEQHLNLKFEVAQKILSNLKDSDKVTIVANCKHDAGNPNWIPIIKHKLYIRNGSQN